MTNLKKNKKCIFGVKFWVRVQSKYKIHFKTINLCYPENLGLLYLFLSKKRCYIVFGSQPLDIGLEGVGIGAELSEYLILEYPKFTLVLSFINIVMC